MERRWKVGLLGGLAAAGLVLGCQEPKTDGVLTDLLEHDDEHPPEALQLPELLNRGVPPVLRSPVTPLAPGNPSNVGREVTLNVVHRDEDFSFRGVGPDGTAYAMRFDSGSKLYASTDGARTWELRAERIDNVRKLAVLHDGVLIANTMGSGGNALSRSTDGGRTWQKVLSLGESRMLTPHSIAELNGDVFYSEYHTTGSGPTPSRLYISRDRGASWSVHHTFEAYRHLHGVIADPATGALWVLAGDATGELVKSMDGGKTWTTMVKLKDTVNGVAVAVDALPLPGGALLYGTDAINRPRAETGIVRIEPDGTINYLGQLPGPSYAVHLHSSGTYFIGTSREPSGNVYAEGDISARLFGSADGVNFKELLAFERISDGSNAHARVFWELPTGELVIEVENVKGFGEDGEGYLLAKPELR